MGTAFILDWDGRDARTQLICAHHLFGPAGGVPTQIRWTEVAAKVTAIRCAAVARHETWRGGHALALPGAEPVGPHYQRDLSAFPLDSTSQGRPSTHSRLATQPPKSGAPVWLLAQVAGCPGRQLLHHASVIYARDDRLEYRQDNAAVNFRATSDAPVLNADGDVVGVHLSHVQGNDGAVHGIDDSLASIRALLASAK